MSRVGSELRESVAQLSKLRSTFVQILDFAVRRGLVASNPATYATVPAGAAKPTASRSLTPDEARTLYDALEEEPLGHMFRLGLLIGLRPGELAGLHWADVDFNQGTLTVGHAVQMKRGRGVQVDQLKTTSSYRTIGLPTAALVELRQQLQRVAGGDELPPGLRVTLVFPSEAGTVLDPANVRRDLTRICASTKVPRITPNELRHTCATLLNDDGVPLELIADMLGHTTTAMLQRHYRHRVRPSADAAVATMDRLFQDQHGQPASMVSRARKKSTKASDETSRRVPRRNDRSSPERKKR